LAGLLTPAVEELEESVLVRSELFERMTRDPGTTPATNQLDWLISVTAMIVWS